MQADQTPVCLQIGLRRSYRSANTCAGTDLHSQVHSTHSGTVQRRAMGWYQFAEGEPIADGGENVIVRVRAINRSAPAWFPMEKTAG